MLMSIESKHGVEEPGYRYKERSAVEPVVREWGHTLTIHEVFAAFLLPISSFGFAIWRFGRGDVGPGAANLLLGVIGWLVAIILLIHHVI
jgi:hypothetical protein